MSRQRRRQSPALGRCRAMSTKVDTSRSRWRATSISGLWPDTLSATRCAPISSCERRNGGGQACGNSVILREERSLLAAWPIDMPANWLERVNQTDDCAGTGSASSECATRPPLWPAGMAEGNRETFGPRVGLSSHGSPAKGGPKTKCLARVKIARTSAGPPSLTIGPVPLSPPDPSRFLPQFNNRTRPAFSPRTRPAFSPRLSRFLP